MVKYKSIKKTSKNKPKQNLNTQTQKKNSYVFNEEHYHSSEGMLTSVWGPSLWHFLHTISFNYPTHPSETQKDHYRKFILSFKNILPCKYCRDNFKQNIKTLPLNKKVFKNRDTLSRYVYELHEVVNKTLGKTSNLTYIQVRDRYEHFRARCNAKKNTNKSRRNRFEPKNKTKKNKKHKGCTDPLHGKRTKCVLSVVPANKKCKTFTMNT